MACQTEGVNPKLNPNQLKAFNKELTLAELSLASS